MRCYICNSLSYFPLYSEDADDICGVCQSIIAETVEDEFPDIMIKEYSYAGRNKDGLVPPCDVVY